MASYYVDILFARRQLIYLLVSTQLDHLVEIKLSYYFIFISCGVTHSFMPLDSLFLNTPNGLFIYVINLLLHSVLHV